MKLMTTAYSFQPIRVLAQGDWQTILPEVWARPTRVNSLWWQMRQRVHVPLADGDHLLACLHPKPEDEHLERPLIIHFHGLGSHADSATLKGLSYKAHAAGFHSLRVNWRGAGGSENLGCAITSGVGYQDVVEVVRFAHQAGYHRIYLTGLSLGGAVVLNALARGEGLPPIAGAVCVSAPLNFGATSQSLLLFRNRFYDARFVWLMKQTIRRFVERGKGGERHRPLLGQFQTIHTVYDFDNAITAKLTGFDDADAYYRAASPGPHLNRIKTPTLFVTAGDDPFVPIAKQREFLNQIHRDTTIETIVTQQGGHVGYVARHQAHSHAWEDRFWLENVAIRWIQDQDLQH